MERLNKRRPCDFLAWVDAVHAGHAGYQRGVPIKGPGQMVSCAGIKLPMLCMYSDMLVYGQSSHATHM